MGAAATGFKRAFVRQLLVTALADSTTLLALLKTTIATRLTAVEGGKVVVGTGANRHQVAWQMPDNFGPVDAVEMVEEIWTRYEEAKAKLIDDGTASPTDTQIHDEMLLKLQPIRTVVGDYWSLRIDQLESSVT